MGNARHDGDKQDHLWVWACESARCKHGPVVDTHADVSQGGRDK